MKKKILITGGAGFLGTTWAKKSSSDNDVHVTLNKTKHQIKNVTSHWLDLTDEKKVFDLISNLLPDIVINTAGLTSVDDCEANPELAQQMNVDTVKNIAKATRNTSVKLVHLSTDHLFDGLQKLYVEESEVHPLNEYAKTKRQAELEVLGLDPRALIVRSNFYGKSKATKKSFTDWLEMELSQKHQIKMYTDLFFSPIYINDLIDFTNIAIKKDVCGILNITGSERISKFDFGITFAKVFNFDQTSIHPSTLIEFPKKVVRPKDMSLSPDKFFKMTGLKSASVKESLEKMKKEMEKNHD